MSRQVDQILNKVLKSVRDDAKKGRVKEYGICNAAMNRVDWILSYRASRYACAFRLVELICSWPDTNDPKDHRNAVCDFSEFRAEGLAGTQWQNPRRLALLDWMIKETGK